MGGSRVDQGSIAVEDNGGKGACSKFDRHGSSFKVRSVKDTVCENFSQVNEM